MADICRPFNFNSAKYSQPWYTHWYVLWLARGLAPTFGLPDCASRVPSNVNSRETLSRIFPHQQPLSSVGPLVDFYVY